MSIPPTVREAHADVPADSVTRSSVQLELLPIRDPEAEVETPAKPAAKKEDYQLPDYKWGQDDWSINVTSSRNTDLCDTSDGIVEEAFEGGTRTPAPRLGYVTRIPPKAKA